MNPGTFSGATRSLVKAYEAVASDLLLTLKLTPCKVDSAPNTYEALLDATRRGELPYSDENASTAIYPGNGNDWFRIMHDCGHVAFQLDFSLPSEVQLAHVMWPLLSKYIPRGGQVDCYEVYLADTVGQSLYCEKFGEFPKDQRAFVVDWLVDGRLEEQV